MPADSRRRRGHRETPIIIGLFWIVCTLGMGAMTVVRDAKRADKIGETLEAAEKWAAFGRGCAWGTATFIGLLIALFVCFAVVFWLEDWRDKLKQKP